MEQGNKKVLGEESVYPDQSVLQKVLGDSYASYCDLINLYDQHAMTHDWIYYHDVNVWLCKVQKKKKTIVWMSAQTGYMNASIYIHEKFAEEVYRLEIGEDMKEKFRAARKMGKSLACTFDVTDSSVLGDFEKVMNLKIGLK